MFEYKMPASLIYPHPHPFAALVRESLAQGVLAFLAQGEPGTGKTTLGREWGKQAVTRGGGWTVFAQANAWLSDESAIRGVNLAGFVERNPAGVYAPGFLLRALEAQRERPGRPGVVVVDEWDKAKATADGLLLAALEERLVVDSAGNEYGRLAPTTLFYITSNATREIHPALRRRCLVLNFPPLTGEALAAALVKAGAGRNLAGLLATIGDEARRSGRPVALSEFQRLASLAPRLPGRDAVGHLVAGLALPRKNAAGDIWAAVCRDRGRK